MFMHPLLLGGLLLAGLPVLLHLLMQQQPKKLLFPAFRFLQQRKQTNQQKMKLRQRRSVKPTSKPQKQRRTISTSLRGKS